MCLKIQGLWRRLLDDLRLELLGHLWLVLVEEAHQVLFLGWGALDVELLLGRATDMAHRGLIRARRRSGDSIARL